MSGRILIKGGTVVSMDRDVGDLRQGDVLIEDGTIVAVAASIAAGDCEQLSAEGMVVMPGLVDSHRHLWYSALRGTGMDCVLDDLHTGLWPKVASHYTAEDLYVCTRAAIADALDHGITTVLDWCHVINGPEHADEALRAHREMPVRTVFAYGTSMARRVRGSDGEPAGDDAWEPVRRLQNKSLSGASRRLTLALALPSPESTALEVTTRNVAAARELGVPMSMHVGLPESPASPRSIISLAEADMLGPDMNFVHCCTTTNEEFRLLADAGATATVCPMAELSLGIGTPPTGRMRDSGLPPAFGTDAVSSASGDLFDEARIGLLFERFLRGRARPDMTTREALEAVTINGARACWQEQCVGSLTPGKRADVVLLRASDLNLSPMSAVVATLVGSGHGSNVDTVIVDGTVAKRDGHLVGIDVARIRASLSATRDRLFSIEGYPGRAPL